MPQIYDMGPPALLPLRRKACWGFFTPWKIRRLRPGLNPRPWVLEASMHPLDHRIRSTFGLAWRWKISVTSGASYTRGKTHRLSLSKETRCVTKLLWIYTLVENQGAFPRLVCSPVSILLPVPNLAQSALISSLFKELRKSFLTKNDCQHFKDRT
jgi:hypothetical protein